MLCGEIDQFHTSLGSAVIEAELTNRGAKNTFQPDFRIKTPKEDLSAMNWELVIYLFRYEYRTQE